MATLSPVDVVHNAQRVGIITLEHLRECWDELGSQNAPPVDLFRLLQRKGYLTTFQIDRLKKNETSGYFYSNNKVLYKIASGGFARVYRGINLHTGEPVAIKVLRQRWANDKSSLDAFYHEGKVGQALRHPNIVRIDEVTGRDTTHFIVMEFIEGGNLRDLLKIRGGQLPHAEAIRLMHDAIQGLHYAYEEGVAHRDIKLSNLLASTQGTLKLVDFGLASVHKSEQRAEEAHGQRTVEYGALERTTGVPKGDPRSDIFFLGTAFYQMVSGVSPIPEKRTREDRMLRSRLDNIRPIREIDADVDTILADIIDRMMALDPYQRYQTPQEVIYALAPLVGAAPAPAQEARTNDRGRTRTILFVEADAGLQDAVREKLHALGYRVLITSDPRRGVERFEEQPMDCVIVDCETTGKPGLNAFLDMEASARNKKMSWSGVVMLTAEQSEWVDRVPGDGRSVAMVKPITMRQLKDQVQELVPTSRGS
ncbi:MAG: protein kinase [Planctomycetes bacterium]|nr:protein kinase [Planctomycetota bacterium]